MIKFIILIITIIPFIYYNLKDFITYNNYRRKYNTMREKSIDGTYIGDAIGYCHYEQHTGALNKKLAYKHKCIAKKCKHLEKYSEEAWKKKDHYRNNNSR
jgi:hypothetical protein